MKLELKTDANWNDKRLTLIEEPSGMGDGVKVCIHAEGDGPDDGVTVRVYACDLIRAANMLNVPYQADRD